MAATRRTLPDTDRQRILELHDQGMSRNDIARETGRAAATVTKVVHDAGRSFDRTATADATAAKKADAAERRATAQLVELEILELEQARVIGTLKGTTKHRRLVRAGEGAEEVRTLDFLPADDARSLSQARSQSVTIIGNLARLDADHGEQAARSLLVGLATTLGLTDTHDEPAD